MSILIFVIIVSLLFDFSFSFDIYSPFSGFYGLVCQAEVVEGTPCLRHCTVEESSTQNSPTPRLIQICYSESVQNASVIHTKIPLKISITF